MTCDICRELDIECKNLNSIHVFNDNNSLRTLMSFLNISCLNRFFEKQSINCATIKCKITLVC